VYHVRHLYPCLYSDKRVSVTLIRVWIIDSLSPLLGKCTLSTMDALLQRAIHRMTDYVRDKGRETRRLVVKRLIGALLASAAPRRCSC